MYQLVVECFFRCPHCKLCSDFGLQVLCSKGYNIYITPSICVFFCLKASNKYVVINVLTYTHNDKENQLQSEHNSS